MFTTTIMCAWCHRLVLLASGAPTKCPARGHRADLPRLDCDCAACSIHRDTLAERDRRPIDPPGW